MTVQRIAEITKNLEAAWSTAAKRAEQEKKNEPEPPTLEEMLAKARQYVESTLDKAGYDTSGIRPDHLDFIIKIASERLVKASIDGKPVGELTDEHIGFVLVGKPMAGKTYLMRLLGDIKAIPKPVGEATIKNEFQIGGLDKVFSAYPDLRGRDFTLDDLGALSDSKRYGNGDLVMSIMFERYEQWQSGRQCTTFISTNLAGYDDLKDSYGLQIANRLANMCAIIPIVGENRGLSVNKRFFYEKKA